MPTSQAINRWVRWAGCLVIVLGAAALGLSPWFGPAVSAQVWLVEPMAYAGAAAVILGLAVVALSYFLPRLLRPEPDSRQLARQASEAWGNLTLQYFQLFYHDLGRPLSRILGKERELRSLLLTTESELYPQVKGLLDEIENQAPNFRLMMSNVQVLVQMEAPDSPIVLQPVEPAEVVRRIVDRYTIVADDSHKAITWWAEPADFGIVYSDSSAIEHIVTNLVDNSVRYAANQVEISLTKSSNNFYVRVWDDGPGIAAPLPSAHLRPGLDAGNRAPGGTHHLGIGPLHCPHPGHQVQRAADGGLGDRAGPGPPHRFSAEPAPGRATRRVAGLP